MKKISALLLIWAFFEGRIFCAQSAGATAANFIKIPVSPIACGLNEAYSAMIGPDSIMYNPGASGLLSYNSVSVSHNIYFAGISQQYLAANFYTRHF